MPKISAAGLFCLDRFENNQTRTCTTFFRTSKLTEVYFNFFLTSKRSYPNFEFFSNSCHYENRWNGQRSFSIIKNKDLISLIFNYSKQRSYNHWLEILVFNWSKLENHSLIRCKNLFESIWRAKFL